MEKFFSNFSLNHLFCFFEDEIKAKGYQTSPKRRGTNSKDEYSAEDLEQIKVQYI
jgi:hypothetical protein